MANLMLTEYCNLRCSYCFAREKIKRQMKEVSLKNVLKYITFLKESNIDECCFCGGEPTLHSRFAQIVKLSLESNMGIALFTNGTWSPQVTGTLAKIPRTKLGILLNVNRPSYYNRHIWRILNNNLDFLKDYYEGQDGLRLSLNIFEKDFEYEYILDLAKRYNVKVIRFATCVPIFGGENKFIHFEDRKNFGSSIIEFVRAAKEANIFTRPDCGLVPCTFTSEQIAELIENNNLSEEENVDSFRRICVPVIDIGTDLMVWRCFPTSGIIKIHLSYFNNFQEIRQYFDKVYENCLSIFPSQECYLCNWAITKQCRGGCLAHTINKELST